MMDYKSIIIKVHPVYIEKNSRFITDLWVVVHNQVVKRDSNLLILAGKVTRTSLV